MVLTFGNVEGLAVLIATEPAPVVRVTVYLETSMGVDVVREVEVEVEVGADAESESRDATDRSHGLDLWWEADQWTQDTIAALLLPRGWELIGAMDPPTREADEVPRSPRYVLRTQFWVPPPGWDDLDAEHDTGASLADDASDVPDSPPDAAR